MDDRTKLPKERQYIDEGFRLSTLGSLAANLHIKLLQGCIQPEFAIVDKDLKVLKKIEYISDPEKFKNEFYSFISKN